MTIEGLWKKYRFKVISISAIIILVLLLSMSVRSCIDYKNRNENNIIALTDSIKYYTDKVGGVVAMKTLLEGDMNTLKLANKELYDAVKAMGINKPTSVVHIGSTVDNPKKDTAWVIHDSLIYIGDSNKVITKNFAFNNQFRSLEGNVSLTDTLLGLNISKDQVYLDYTLAIKDNKVYVKSSNPYVKYDELIGITLPKTKQKRFSIGPSVGFGYDIANKRLAPIVGVSFNWNLIKF